MEFSNAVLWPYSSTTCSIAFRPTRTGVGGATVRSTRSSPTPSPASGDPATSCGSTTTSSRSCPGCSASASTARRSTSSSTSPSPPRRSSESLPWRDQILEGMLGADLIGFHTFTYRSHFASSVLRILGISTPGDRVFFDGREIKLGVFPIGVDAQTFGKLAGGPGSARGSSPDPRRRARSTHSPRHRSARLHEGDPRRLLAFERMLEHEPHWRGKVKPSSRSPCRRATRSRATRSSGAR